MNKTFSIALAVAASLAGLAWAADDDAEPVAQVLTLTASNFTERTGATLAGEVEGWQRIGPDEVMTAAAAILRREAATVLRVKPRTSTRRA